MGCDEGCLEGCPVGLISSPNSRERVMRNTTYFIVRLNPHDVILLYETNLKPQSQLPVESSDPREVQKKWWEQSFHAAPVSPPPSPPHQASGYEPAAPLKELRIYSIYF